MLPAADVEEQLARVIVARLVARQTDPQAWRSQARPEQLPPDGEWTTWYLRGGRGGGKTWTGAHMLAEWTQKYPGMTWAIVAPTYPDARDKCVEGESGLLAAFGTTRAEVDAGRSALVEYWHRSLHDIKLRNGTIIWVDGADDGAPTVQGENLAGAWADEVGLWKRTQWSTAWNEALTYAIRKEPARVIATGTPKRGHPLVKLLMDDPSVVKTRVRTLDNIDNLAPTRVQELIDKHGGTTLGRQELEGEMLDDLEGALWNRGLIRYRPPVELQRIVVGLDPNASNDPGADTAGIVVAGRGVDGLCYVLEDRTAVIGPLAWARQALDAAYVHGADCIVAEGNNGGEMVRITLATVDPKVRVKIVHASRGKQARAEPIVALYEQSKVFHVEPMPDLEDEQCNWDPREGGASPGRIDALVWAVTDLMTDDPWAGAAGSSIS